EEVEQPGGAGACRHRLRFRMVVSGGATQIAAVLAAYVSVSGCADARQPARASDDDIRFGSSDALQRLLYGEVFCEALMDEAVEALVAEGFPPRIERHVAGA